MLSFNFFFVIIFTRVEGNSMKNKNQLYFAVIFVFLLVITTTGVSFAYINKATVSGNTNVNLTVLNATNDLNLTYSGNTSVAINVTLDDLASNKVGSAVTNSTNISVNFKTSSYYPSGAKCYYTVSYSASSVYTPTTTGNELTISGSLNGTNKFEKSIGSVSNVQLYSGYISTSQANTTVTQNWVFSLNFYNLNSDQTGALGQNPKGTIVITPGNCEAN